MRHSESKLPEVLIPEKYHPSLTEKLKRSFDRNYFRVDPRRANAYLLQNRSQPKSQADVFIPLGSREFMNYKGKVMGSVADRPISSYQTSLFPDVYGEASPVGSYSPQNYLLEAPPLENPEPVFGGADEVFKPGNVVLNVASGEALGDLQLALKYPETTFIGVDILYQEEHRVFPKKPGLQLTHADWHYLKAIPDASVDAILSIQGITMWGLPFLGNEQRFRNDIPVENGFKIIKAIQRISKPGTILRFDDNEDDVFLREHLGLDWEICDRKDVFLARRKR